MTEQFNFEDYFSFLTYLGLNETNSNNSFKIEESVETVLDEGIFRSYRGTDVVNMLLKKYNFGIGKTFIENGYDIGIWGETYSDIDSNVINEILALIVCVPSDFKDLEKIKKFMETCGWMFSLKYKSKIDGYFEYRFEKNRQTNKINVGQYLYHLVPENKLNKILTNGLTPHSGNKKTEHPERVYLLVKSLTKEQAQSFATALWKATIKNKMINSGMSPETAEKESSLIQRNIKYALLSIDTQKCLKNTEFYGDKNFQQYAVWTYNNIPPKAITVIEKNI